MYNVKYETLNSKATKYPDKPEEINVASPEV